MIELAMQIGLGFLIVGAVGWCVYLAVRGTCETRKRNTRTVRDLNAARRRSAHIDTPPRGYTSGGSGPSMSSSHAAVAAATAATAASAGATAGGCAGGAGGC